MKLIPDQYIKEKVEIYPHKEASKPLVSVCIQTYNQEEYIRNCIESILNQVTDFEFEIVIGEDASSDKTRDICIEYAKKYPEKIRLVLHKRENVIYIENQPLGTFNGIYNMQVSKGDFIATCDGDDYWISPNKLQKQIDVFRKDKECALVFGNYNILKSDGTQSQKYELGEISSDKLFDIHYLLSINVMPAYCTLMFRKEFIPSPFPNFIFDSFNGDWAYLFVFANKRKIGYIEEPVSVYRLGVGIVSKTNNYAKLQNGLRANRAINAYTNFEYDYHIGNEEWLIKNIAFSLLENKQRTKGVLKVFYKLFYSFSKRKLKYFFKENKQFLKHATKLLFGLNTK